MFNDSAKTYTIFGFNDVLLYKRRNAIYAPIPCTIDSVAPDVFEKPRIRITLVSSIFAVYGNKPSILVLKSEEKNERSTNNDCSVITINKWRKNLPELSFI